MAQHPSSSESGAGAGALDLVGQWRARLSFSSGEFAGVDDLEFMYAFNAGGTMTESSNYDAAPPVPPAYGIWRRIGPDRFEAKYEFYPTTPPAALADLTGGGGWRVAGRGVFTETIVVAADGAGFTATILYEIFAESGEPLPGGGEATSTGVPLRF
ncbi:MAG: hypothetical protein WCN81_08610 [Actinomycetes bacterium]